MLDSYLGQAGFGEQIQLYGDVFWRQLGSTLLWAFLVIWSVLVVVAIVVALFRRADVNEDMKSARELDEVLLARRTNAARGAGGPAAGGPAAGHVVIQAGDDAIKAGPATRHKAA